MSDAMNGATDESLRDDLAAALGGSDEVTETVETVETQEVQAETQEQIEQRERDERGRFAKRQEEQQEAQQSAEQQAAQEVAQQPQLKKPPQSWKPELKAHFDTLPPEVQDEILRRETDYSKGIQKYAEDAKYAQTFRQVVDPWMPYISQLGTTPDQAFAYLIGAEYQLRNGSPAEKQQALQKLAKDYGIELGQQTQEQGLDPNVQHAVQRVQQLERYIQNLEYSKKQEAERQQQAAMAEVTQRVSEFASSPDVPHFEKVREDMAQLLSAGYAADLKDAYEKACWARPDIRASLLKEQEGKRIQEQAQAANKAKAKAVSVTGSPSGAAVPVPGASLRDDLAAAFTGSGRL